MKNQITLFCCFLYFSTNTLLFSQENGGFLNFTGKVVDRESAPVKGVTIKLIKDNIDALKLTTKKNGQFTFMIFFDGDYKISISYPGCADMYLIVYASKGKGNFFPAYQTDITLYSDTTHRVNVAMFKQPFLKLIFDGKESFIVDQRYDIEFKKQLLYTADSKSIASPVAAVTYAPITPAVTKEQPSTTASNTANYSKKNYPKKFVFVDTDKDNALSLVEVNAVINKFKVNNASCQKGLVEELIAWFFE